MVRHYSYNALVRDLESQEGVVKTLREGLGYLEEIKDRSDDSIIFLSNIISIAEARLRQIRDEKTKHNQDEKEREADEILALCEQIGITPMYDISGLPPIEPGIVRLSPDGKLLAVSDDRNGEVALFSASYMKEIGKLYGAGSKILSLEFSGGEPYLSGITKAGDVVIWDLEKHVMIGKHRFLDAPLDDRQSIKATWSDNGRSYGGIIEPWDKKPRLITWNAHDNDIQNIELGKYSDFGLTYHPDGEMLSYVHSANYNTFDIVIYNPCSSEEKFRKNIKVNDNHGKILVSGDNVNIHLLIGQEFIVLDWNLNIIKREIDHKIDPNIMSYYDIDLSLEENHIALKLSVDNNNRVKKYFFDFEGELSKIFLHQKEEKNINGITPGKSSRWSILREVHLSKEFLVHPIIMDDKPDHVDIGLLVLKNVDIDRYRSTKFGPYDLDEYSYGSISKDGKNLSVIDNSFLKEIDLGKWEPNVIIPYHQQTVKGYVGSGIEKHPGLSDTLNGRPYLLKIFEIDHEQIPGLYKEYSIPIKDHINEIVHQKSSDGNYIVINPGRNAIFLNLKNRDSIIEKGYEKWFSNGFFSMEKSGIYLNTREGKELIDEKKAIISSSPTVKIYLTEDEVIVNVKDKKEFKFKYIKFGSDNSTKRVPNVFTVTEDGRYFSWLDDDCHLVLFDLLKGEKVFRRSIAQPMGLYPLQVKANGAFIFADLNHNRELDFSESMVMGEPPFSSVDLVFHEKNMSVEKSRTFNNPIRGVLKTVKTPEYKLNEIWTERRGGQRFFGGEKVHMESSRVCIVKSLDYFTSQIKVYQLGKDKNSEIGITRSLHWTFSPLADPKGNYIALEWESQDKPKEPIHDEDEESNDDDINGDMKKMRSYYRILDVNKGNRCKPVLQSKHGSWALPLFESKPFGWLSNGEGIWANHEDEEGNKRCRIWHFKDDQIETRNINGLLHRFENDKLFTRNPLIINEELLFDSNGEYIGKKSILPYDRHLERDIQYNGNEWFHFSRWSSLEEYSIYSSKPILKEKIPKENVRYPIPSDHRYDSDIGKFNFNILVHKQGLPEMIRGMNTVMDIDEDLPHHIRTDYVDGYLVTYTPLLLDEYSSEENPFHEVMIYHKEGSKPLFKIDKVVGKSIHSDHYTPFYYNNGKFLIIRREGAIFELILADMIQRDITEKITFEKFRIDSQLIPYYFDEEFYCLYQHSKDLLLFYKWNNSDFKVELDLKENKIHPDYKPFRIGNHLFVKFGERVSGKEGILVDIGLISFNGTYVNPIYEDRNEPSILSVWDNNHSVVFSSYDSCNNILLPDKSIVWTIQYLPGERILWGDGLRAWVVNPQKYPLKEVASKD